ncbi:MAG: Hint domain-containing protein, partial [Planktomarina sp.]
GGTEAHCGNDTTHDCDTLDLSDVGLYEIVNETNDLDGNSTSGTVNLLDTFGNVTGNIYFEEIEKIIPCFTPGTMIATPRGEVAVEDLNVGDKVLTRDNGMQEILWYGSKAIDQQDLLNDPKLRPVMITAGSLGHGLPEKDLMVSPNHRVLISNTNTALLFDDEEVLVAAKHLVDKPGIHTVDVARTDYIHFMFEQHEVVLSNGTWTESFQPGELSLNGIDDDQRDELYKLFPELQNDAGRQEYKSARHTLKAYEAKLAI